MNSSCSKPARRRRRSALAWVTAISGVSSLFLLLNFFFCIRLEQGSQTLSDGSITWHEYSLYRAQTFESDAWLLSSVPPARRPIIEWTGGAALERVVPLGVFRKLIAVSSGTPLVMLPPLVLLLTLPLWVRAWIASRRQRAKDRCPACGYSMFGLPAPMCPECGTPRQQAASEQPAAAVN
ncbi:MAG: hypothetical protein K2Q09_01495 [Phycisphaerales bacterium]|nr:hypothetical protein [Phycisphaerales bacterium]